jgi:hypothetical protein
MVFILWEDIMSYSNYYYHGTGGFKGAFCALNRIESIFCDEKISIDKNVECIDYTLSQNEKRTYLCDRTRPAIPEFSSSLDLYISHSPSLILERGFPVIVPICSRKRTTDKIERTNLYDEVRTDSDIPLTFLVAVSLPITNIIEKFIGEYEVVCNDSTIFLKEVAKKDIVSAYKARVKFMRMAYQVAKNFNISLPVIDLDTEQEIDKATFDCLEAIISNKETKTRKLLLKQ